MIATRIERAPGDHVLAHPHDVIRPGMRLLLNGTDEALDTAIAVLGRPYDIKIEDTGMIFQEYTVSSSEVAGRRIRDIDPLSRGFLIARVRRGDSGFVPTSSTVLNYSDRIRVITAPGSRRGPGVRG